MLSKNEYRSSLNALKPYVKLGVFADMINLNRSSLSKFLKSDMFNYTVKIEDLEKLCELIQQYTKMT